MMAKFVLILYVPGIPALSMSDIDFDFGGVWPKEIIKSNRDCLYVLVRNVTLLLLLLLLLSLQSFHIGVTLHFELLERKKEQRKEREERQKVEKAPCSKLNLIIYNII